MTIEEYGALFRESLGGIGIAAPAGTILHQAALEVHEMAHAYYSDGVAFLASGDPVNALASFAYGLGWLDGGSVLGLLASDSGDCHPPEAVDASIPELCLPHLHEKTHRYRRMLDDALSMVEVGPDEGSPLHAGAERFLEVASSWYIEGRQFLEADDLPGALARFSYGYAWLDAGIRAGLIRITGTRSLFTV